MAERCCTVASAWRDRDSDTKMEPKNSKSALCVLESFPWLPTIDSRLKGLVGKMGHLCVVLNVVMIAVKEYGGGWRGQGEHPARESPH